MVCEKNTREKYPFDIHHRRVIGYSSNAPDDFSKLRQQITEALKAVVQSEEALEKLVENEQIAPISGLSSNEIVMLGSILSNISADHAMVRIYAVREGTEKAGLTQAGFVVALKRLKIKGFINLVDDDKSTQPDYDFLELTDKAWSWIDSNEALFVLKRNHHLE